MLNIGDSVFTPRFLTVRISDVFDSATAAQEAGYVEPTHYMGADAAIYGKSLDPHHMAFAAVIHNPFADDDEPPF